MVLIISLKDISEKKVFEGFFVQFLISAFSYSSHSIQHRKWCEVKLRLCVKNFMRIIQLYLLNDAEDIGTGVPPFLTLNNLIPYNLTPYFLLP